MTEGTIFLGLLIFFFIISTLIFIRLATKGEINDVGEGIIIFLFMGIGSIIPTMIVGLCIAIPAQYIQGSHEIEKHYIYPISLERDSETSGRFILGSGRIETTQYYFFYYESIYGYKLSKIPVDNTYLIETNKRPQIVNVVDRYNGGLIKLEDGRSKRTIIYVPEGTIIKQFNP